jgi:drug/metabolite transporter (DMT)-like permease
MVTLGCCAGLLYAASLWLSNSAYLYLSVSFIQMTKSLMPGLVYFSGCWIGTERFNVSILLDMILIAVGVVVCAFGEENLIVVGLIIQLTALLFEATRLTLVQVRCLPQCSGRNSPVHIILCQQAAMCVFLHVSIVLKAADSSQLCIKVPMLTACDCMIIHLT